jgi:hypothetical protein
MSATDGTPLNRLPDRTSTSGWAKANRSGTSCTVPPQINGVNNSKTDTSKFSEVEATILPSTDTPNRSTAQDSMLTTPPWPTTTPLGVPVEPDV